MLLQAQLMGNPKISMDGSQVFLPFRKAEALLYYLLIKKQATRDTLVNLFWGNVDEETARKNLRNAVYIIKKTCGEELIVSPQRNILMLDEALELQLDISPLLEGGSFNVEDEPAGEFLEGFLVKEAEYFEEWMLEMREHLRDTYVQRARQLLKQKRAELDFAGAEVLCRRLIGVDEYNEEIYRELIDIYSQQGKY
ncbi:MAG: AfsR/SARP family transcriptional regulator, partial [Pseudomonadota bacterium]